MNKSILGQKSFASQAQIAARIGSKPLVRAITMALLAGSLAVPGSVWAATACQIDVSDNFQSMEVSGGIFSGVRCDEQTREAVLPTGYEIDFDRPSGGSPKGYGITVISVNSPGGGQVNSHTLSTTPPWKLTSRVKVCSRNKQRGWYTGTHVIYGIRPDCKNQLLNVTTEGNGTVTSKPAGISCGTGGNQCKQTYPFGTAVTLTAEPAEYFKEWKGNCSGSNPTATVTMNAENANKTCTATFVPSSISGAVWLDLNGDGIRQLPEEKAADFANVFLEYSPLDPLIELTNKEGKYTFTDLPFVGKYILYVGTEDGWAPSFPSNLPYYEIDLQKNQQVTGKDFGIAPLVPLDVAVAQKGSGTITSNPEGISNCDSSCQANYLINQNVVLKATAASSGFSFNNWTGTGECNGSKANPITVKMNVANSCTANFVCAPILSVTPTTLSFPKTGGTKQVTVNMGNCTIPVVTWSASSNSTSWLSVSPSSGTGSVNLKIKALSRNSSVIRTGIITINAGNAGKPTITVTQ